MIAAAFVVVSQGSQATAGGTVSLGGFASEWRMGDARGRTQTVEGRLDMGSRLAFGASYSHLDLPDGMVPANGFAAPPDLRGSIFITPVPNRYFAPYLTLGAGRVRYAQDRMVALGGAGVEIEVQSWLVFQAEWLAIAPGPVAATESIIERRRQELVTGMNRPLSDLVKEHYNLATTQLRFGFRLTY